MFMANKLNMKPGRNAPMKLYSLSCELISLFQILTQRISAFLLA